MKRCEFLRVRRGTKGDEGAEGGILRRLVSLTPYHRWADQSPSRAIARDESEANWRAAEVFTSAHRSEGNQKQPVKPRGAKKGCHTHSQQGLPLQNPVYRAIHSTRDESLARADGDATKSAPCPPPPPPPGAYARFAHDRGHACAGPLTRTPVCPPALLLRRPAPAPVRRRPPTQGRSTRPRTRRPRRPRGDRPPACSRVPPAAACRSRGPLTRGCGRLSRSGRRRRRA